ncbi:flagellar biosynthesis protein FlhF [Thalassobacillus pellis]|uniref:flagellar biosynthesis protein FlhF n=1 Tax=Thalassobacillus pellis TaxID=748008 RepID=UPI00195F4223|nr:flagellar biosynthesis protein FlhF [Thalassobacillus pellis]MBM7552732.1 flagellar biosynthesis protein FlhF [Thalassobacillus pellis]
MKVKKFEAKTMPEVMLQVKKNLGENAVILNSKVVHRGGFLGMFKKKNIEVVAAIDPYADNPGKSQVEVNSKQSTSSPFSIQSENNAIMKEIQSLKKMMVNQQKLDSAITGPTQELCEYLLSQELDQKLVEELTLPVMEKEPGSLLEAKEELARTLTYQMKEYAYGGLDYEKQYIHLVGPTGVGKTTTIAKIAAEAVLNHGKQVAFITTDTYRIAAIDQLKTYARILNIPVEVAYSIEDYLNARDKFKEYDLVLVDTAGRNFRDSKYIHELKKIIDFKSNIATYLVLSLTSRQRDMQEIYDQFSSIPIEKLIFTKADETSSIGAAIQMMFHNSVGVAYLTDGQNVPDDIKSATPELFISRLVGELQHA